ncbi:uncharacterized protein PpBr36_10175 [Pyricularia pennisetigena]|uniref:uncharacterized protein n=1 Tax=Pyricularia pennisetigena TaxID=1578925 RepID=UPI00114DD09D|nr:uncharacterized protein PpBr36_10175 [Pyricularia pennisetigena]TLS21572.1 hypothetical protein PpBr36_10175 [Pyricularia pennisetigena]
MFFNKISIAALATAAIAAQAASSAIDADVVVVGGGTSGAYAAVRLSQDFGKKVLVVEKASVLGGHANTWYDPATKKPFGYGIDVFDNNTASVNYFARFNIATKAPTSDTSVPISADFTDGTLVNYTAPASAAAEAAFGRWREQWKRFESLLLPVGTEFPTGDAIPADLLLPWKDFARKYNLEAFTPRIWTVMGLDVNTALVIDVWKAYYPSNGGFVAASGDNREIYFKIRDLLGDSVMYESEVVSSTRSDAGVRLVVKHKDGSTSTVSAKRLLVTIGPDTMDKTAFDLDDNETAVLHSTWGNRCYTGIVSHPSLPAKTITNTDPAAAGGNFLAYPTTPYLANFVYRANSSFGPVFRSLVIAQKETSFQDAQNIVRGSLQRLMDAGTVPKGDVNQLKFEAFEDHGILYRRWTPEQLRAGIINQANKLQGLRSTWYTGAYWMNNNAAMLWNATDTILPKMLQGI